MLVVGFDLDMTLVDSRPGIRASFAALEADTGVPVDVEVVVNRLGPKLEWELAQWYPEAEVADAVTRYRAHYWNFCVDGTVLLPGAADAVAAVHARGGQVVVVTAKAEAAAHRCLEDGVGLTVEAVVGHVFGDEKTAALVDHGATIYVGDTTTDMQSAKAAGAIGVGVTTGPHSASELEAAGADVVLAALTDFASWLASAT